MAYKDEHREIDLMEYWRVILKRKHILFIFAGTLIVLMGLYSFLAPSKYKPSASLLIEEDTSKILSIQDEFGLMGYSSQMRDMVFLNTQITLLESDSLAERVAKKLDLLSREEFGAAQESGKGLFARIGDIVTFKWLRSKKDPADGEGLADPYRGIIEKMSKALEIAPVKDTKVLRISYTSKHPVLATEIVNTYAQEYINFYIDKKYQTTQQASNFLDERIITLREDVSIKERELQRYAQEKEIVLLTDSESVAHSKYADLDKAYTQAQIDRVNAEAKFRALRDSTVDSLPRTVENRLIQDLEEEYTRMKNEYQQKLEIFKTDYPEMVSLRTKIESMRVQLSEEIQRATALAENEYRAALRRESSLRNLREQQRTDLAQLDSDAILYNNLKTEVENMRRLLNSLEGMKEETKVSAQLKGLETTSISIIDEARVPKHPVSPKKKTNLLLALIFGLFGGAALCFVFEYLDNTIEGPEEVEKIAGIPSLGVIPFLHSEAEQRKKHGKLIARKRSSLHSEPLQRGEDTASEIKEIELVNHRFPNSSFAEDYRTITTSILLSHMDRPHKIMAFTSSLPMEGKTVTVANIAVALAQINKKVLILDLDLRKPRLHRIFKVPNGRGLTSYLTGKCSLDDAVHKTHIENVWLISSGPVHPNPAALLNSDMMKRLIEGTKEEVDYVLLDTPPVLAVVDALSVSAIVESVVLVVQPGKTPKKSLMGAVEQLRNIQANILGVVFNKSDIHTMKYYDKYPHYKHYYGQTSD